MSGPESKSTIIKKLKETFNPTNSMISSGIEEGNKPSSESIEELGKKEQQAISDFLEAKRKSKIELSVNGFYFVSKYGPAVGVVERTGGRGEPHYYYFIDKDGHPINNKESWEPTEEAKFEAIGKISGPREEYNIFIATKRRKDFFINEIGEPIHQGTFDSCYPQKNDEFEIRKGDEKLYAKITGEKVEFFLS
jgi:hypothetical protein